MNWYIGQEIVCIKSHSEGVVKKGQVYTIQGLFKGCCVINIDVGCKSDAKYVVCTICNSRTLKADGIHWLSERIFAPLEYDKQAIKELLENTLIEKL